MKNLMRLDLQHFAEPVGGVEPPAGGQQQRRRSGSTGGSQVMGQDGKINDEALKTALNKVLEDVPALKPTPAGQTGFVQVGATGQSGQQTTNDDALKKAFGL